MLPVISPMRRAHHEIQLLLDEAILDPETTGALRICLSLEKFSFLCRYPHSVALTHRPVASAGAEKWLPFGFFLV